MTLSLSPLSHDDAHELLDWINSPNLINKFDGLKIVTEHEEHVFIEQVSMDKSQRVYSIRNEEGEHIGLCGLHEIKRDTARISIMLGKYRGQGYGQEALKALINVAFNTDIRKVWGITLTTNEVMQHLLTKLGFQQEGFLREEYPTQNGFADMYRYGLLKHEWGDNK